MENVESVKDVTFIVQNWKKVMQVKIFEGDLEEENGVMLNYPSVFDNAELQKRDAELVQTVSLLGLSTSSGMKMVS